ncbi:MAG: DUF3179 domain-containing protein [Planctomycetes bacterium]|nr:DUF3179 domain-containing protein [Planctomycetota bacterium]
MVCHSGVGLTPLVDGVLHHFSAGGLYDGLVLLIDDESLSHWDHTRGDAVHGPLVGKQLEVWPIEMTTVVTEVSTHPRTLYSPSDAGLFARGFGRVSGALAGGGFLGRGLVPPGFKGTMSKPDDRRTSMEHGVGIVVEGRARYYPMGVAREGVTDDWDGRQLQIRMGPDGIPAATWEDDGSRPMQLFTRWYGFSFTYPGCEIFSGAPPSLPS